ncbi:sporulation protein YpjB [Chengkuizengella sp. SCS-71B]|uniref:sporulation protein YpjB n=1 Tax=Chengkuizengella sp. SCS-71B TaxID=3115290 RepID=UPI0032C248FB
MYFFNRKSIFIVYMLIMVFSIILISGCAMKEPNHSAQKVLSLDEENLKQLETMNMLASEMVQKTTEKNYVEARDILLKLSKQLTEVNYDGLTSIEGLQALSDTFVIAKRNFNSVNLSEEDTLISSAKVHLVIDALSHQKEPMWLQYYSVLNSDLNELQTAASLGNKEKMNQLLKTYKQHYAFIRPAMIINRDPENIDQLDSYLTFLQNYISDNDKKENVNAVIEELKRFLKEVFYQDQSSTVSPLADQNLFSWVISIGTIIVSVLFYVGWRKYNYEKTNIFSVKK